MRVKQEFEQCVTVFFHTVGELGAQRGESLGELLRLDEPEDATEARFGKVASLLDDPNFSRALDLACR